MSALKTLSVKLEEIIEDKKIWVNPNPTKVKKTMTQPDLLVYSASGLNEPNFRVVVPANKGFVPNSRVQVKIIKPKLGGFMFFVRALLWQAIYVLCQAFVTRLATF